MGTTPLMTPCEEGGPAARGRRRLEEARLGYSLEVVASKGPVRVTRAATFAEGRAVRKASS